MAWLQSASISSAGVINNSKQHYKIRPNPLPIQAPVAMVGKNIPAGTIIPKAHAVNPTLMIAVVKSKKTFSDIAPGLNRS
jgi:hypothetical protein